MKIQGIIQNENPKLWKAYVRAYKNLEKTLRKKPSEKLMFHLTTHKNALKICQQGFDVNKSRMKAFGKGINLCPSLEEVLKFYRIYKNKKDVYSVVVSLVSVGKAHSNSSDDSILVKNKDGSYFTKPKHMQPKAGFDSMYSDKPLKKIWVIPLSARIYPCFVLKIKL